MEIAVLFPSEDSLLDKKIKRLYVNELGWCERISDTDTVYMFSSPTIKKILIDDGISPSNIKVLLRPTEKILLELFQSNIEKYISSCDSKKKIEVLQACRTLDYSELIDYIITKSFRGEDLSTVEYIIRSFPPSRYFVSQSFAQVLLDKFPHNVTLGKQKGKSTLIIRNQDKRSLDNIISTFKEMELSNGIKFVLDQAILTKDVKILGIVKHLAPIRLNLCFRDEIYPESFLRALLNVVPYNSSYIPVLFRYQQYNDILLKDPTFSQSFEFYHENLSKEIIEDIWQNVLENDIVHLFKYLPLEKWGPIPKHCKKIHEFIRLKSLES